MAVFESMSRSDYRRRYKVETHVMKLPFQQRREKKKFAVFLIKRTDKDPLL